MRSLSRPLTRLCLAFALTFVCAPAFGKIEAVRGKRYTLGKQHGPWMIMVASFRDVEDDELRTEGLSASEAADELVFELREKGIPAYVFEQKAAMGSINTFDRTGRRSTRVFAAQHGMISVLAGNYATIDPKEKQGKIAQKTLAFVKKMHPDVMDKGGRYRPTPGRPGPLSGAFLSVNPLLSPEEALERKSDPLIVQLNSGMEHSLLKCPGKYSLVIKTYSGKSVAKLADSSFADAVARFDANFSESSLDDAAMSAWELTEAMRNATKLGYPTDYEAYVYHDRYNSMVTVGSFDSPNDPRIAELAELFRGKIKKNPSTGRDFLAAEIFTIPRNPPPNQLPKKSWVFDPKPRVMEVPRIHR